MDTASSCSRAFNAISHDCSWNCETRHKAQKLCWTDLSGRVLNHVVRVRMSLPDPQSRVRRRIALSINQERHAKETWPKPSPRVAICRAKPLSFHDKHESALSEPCCIPCCVPCFSSYRKCVRAYPLRMNDR